jgi:hypothetical protein
MAVKPGGGHANPRSKYNSPDTVNGRYRRGNRRWSSYDRALPEKRKVKDVDPQFWYVGATIITTGGGYGGGTTTTRTYTCSCPDFAKQESASYYGPDYIAGPKQFTPRVHKLDSYSHYQSSWIRFQKGFQLLSQVVFVGIQAPSTWIYRFPTSRIQKYNRDWTDSKAGVKTNGYCKHIWAVILYRGDPYTQPTDNPDFYSIEDLDVRLLDY